MRHALLLLLFASAPLLADEPVWRTPCGYHVTLIADDGERLLVGDAKTMSVVDAASGKALSTWTPTKHAKRVGVNEHLLLERVRNTVHFRDLWTGKLRNRVETWQVRLTAGLILTHDKEHGTRRFGTSKARQAPTRSGAVLYTGSIESGLLDGKLVMPVKDPVALRCVDVVKDRKLWDRPTPVFKGKNRRKFPDQIWAVRCGRTVVAALLTTYDGFDDTGEPLKASYVWLLDPRRGRPQGKIRISFGIDDLEHRCIISLVEVAEGRELVALRFTHKDEKTTHRFELYDIKGKRLGKAERHTPYFQLLGPALGDHLLASKGWTKDYAMLSRDGEVLFESVTRPALIGNSSYEAVPSKDWKQTTLRRRDEAGQVQAEVEMDGLWSIDALDGEPVALGKEVFRLDSDLKPTGPKVTFDPKARVQVRSVIRRVGETDEVLLLGRNSVIRARLPRADPR